MDHFDRLYKSWESNGFNRKDCPSIDRMDNKRGYEPDNMQWLPLSENSQKFTK